MAVFGNKKTGAKVQFSTLGVVMIDGLKFSFGVESIGKASNGGLCVTVSGDGVDDGSVTFDNLEYHEMHGGKVTIVKMDFPLVEKSDGKRIYKASFDKIPLTEYSTGSFFKKPTEQSVIDRLNAEISFKVTPHYKGAENGEVLLSVYPNDNPMYGICSQWLDVTADTEYFQHKFKR